MTTTSNETPNNQTWYLDTGCMNHMCGQKELFADLDDSFRTKVKFGDGRFVSVTWKGWILITLKNGDHMYIYDVFYVPDMKSNFLSMGQLTEKGYVMHIVENQFLIFDKKCHLILKTFLSKNCIFLVYFHMGDFRCLNAIVNNESWLWHLRFWHLNFQSLENLSNRNLVPTPAFSTRKELKMKQESVFTIYGAEWLSLISSSLSPPCLFFIFLAGR